MDYIICHFTLFDLHQKVYYKNDVVAISTNEDLGENIANLCNKYNCNKVHLYGNEEYAAGIIEDIHIYSGTKYGINNIEIEVN